MHRDTIHGYYLDTYRPENLTVAAAGDVDHDAVVALADALLGDLGRPGGQVPRRAAPTGYVRGEVTVRERPTEQAHLVLGGPGLAQDDDDRWAMRVLDVALGGGMSSRLFQELRETRGLCYSTYSYSSSYTDGGLFGAYVGTAPGKVEEALGLLREELDRVADDVADDEVARAKGALTGGTVLGLEDTGSRMSRIGKQVATGRDIVTVDEALARIDAVTVDDVRRVAGRVLAGPRDLAVVGPFAPADADRFADAIR
ncbi:insulinase family protein [Nitriliruptoraceae bacterium ZYF776]|nr:insulinase family protein [Profundirhabdus halotolerans]